jgi:hypothetical protein
MTRKQSNVAEETVRSVDAVLDRVLARRFDDVVRDVDEYALLLQRREWRELVVLELYDAFFPPPRHEFEYEIIQQMVRAVAESGTASFVANAVATGMIGTVSWEIVRGVVGAVKKRLHGHLRGEPFADIQRTVDGLEKFFKRRRRATTPEIAEAIGTEAHKVEPLLRLLGFKAVRRKGKRVWERP